MRAPPSLLWHANGVGCSIAYWKNFDNFWLAGMLVLAMLFAAFLLEVGKRIK